MRSIIKYTLLTASRDWLFLGLFMLVMLFTSLSVFLGSTALAEQKMMSTVFIGGCLRMIIIVGLILFVCFHVRRAFDNKEVELILSRPVSRNAFVFAYLIGFAILAFTIVLPIGILFMVLNALDFIDVNLSGLAYWMANFYLETITMISIAFFAALILTSAVSCVLFCFTFYFMTRFFGFLLISINNPFAMTKGSIAVSYMERLLDFIGIVIPRFDMMSKSEWLVYGVGDNNMMFLFSILFFIPLIISMTLFDFSRKQF